MEVLYPRCAGLDVHKDSVVAAVRCVSPPVHHEVRSFPTTTQGLVALAEWLGWHRCSHVAMEATGVSWKPVWHLLEEHFELVLANAQHVRNVPGRSRPARRSLALRPACSPSRPVATLSTEGSVEFVASLDAPIATGWSDSCRAGLSPAGYVRLLTAH
jgi:hypothetical protein